MIDPVPGIVPNGTDPGASDQNHRGFAGRSEHPGLTQFTRLIAAEPELGILQSSGEAVDDHRIATAVDGVLNLADHASQSFGRQPALEDRELHARDRTFRRSARHA